MTEITKDKRTPLPLYKIIIFSLTPLVVLLVLSEIGIRLVYYQMHAGSSSALVAAIKEVKARLDQRASQREAERLEKELGLPPGVKLELFTPAGRELLAYLQERYRECFSQLVKDTAALGSKLAVLYIPSDFKPDSPGRERCRSFYQDLSREYRLDFLDLSEVFRQYPVEAVTLLPQNGHLSRFGNRLVAAEVAKFLEQQKDHRLGISFDQRPRLLGDLKPQDDQIWLYVPAMPYRVVTNSQGLRMNYDLEFPKKKPRVLCLGDSFTFGPYLPNHDTYPGLLQQMFPDKEIINAGVCGYNIADEVSLLKERAKYCEPDIIIFQVLDNDLEDFLYFKRRVFARERKDYQPTSQEQEYFRRLRSQGKLY
jgi:lysophospholipase L1-like esterase